MKVLVLAPHTDDGEFGCGGTIAKWVEEGHHVIYVAFSCAEKSVPEGFSPDALEKEVKQATTRLGVQELRVYHYEVRSFPEHRQEILERLIQLREELKPETVLLPSSYDTHQDHEIVSEEGFRAFKACTILGYELPWNNMEFQTTAFVPLHVKHVLAKIAALKCYKSQQNRSYASPSFVRSLASVRGTQIGVPMAESFEVIRWIVR